MTSSCNVQNVIKGEPVAAIYTRRTSMHGNISRVPYYIGWKDMGRECIEREIRERERGRERRGDRRKRRTMNEFIDAVQFKKRRIVSG